MTNATAPPKHHSAETRKLWRSVLADHELEQRQEAVHQTELEALDLESPASTPPPSRHQQRCRYLTSR